MSDKKSDYADSISDTIIPRLCFELRYNTTPIYVTMGVALVITFHFETEGKAK